MWNEVVSSRKAAFCQLLRKAIVCFTGFMRNTAAAALVRPKTSGEIELKSVLYLYTRHIQAKSIIRINLLCKICHTFQIKSRLKHRLKITYRNFIS